MDDAIALVAGHARAEIDARMRWRARIFQFPWHRRAAPDTRGDARCPRCMRAIRSFPIRTALPMRASNSNSARGALARNFGDHPHAIHGIGWHRPWTIRARDESSALLALDHDAGGEGRARMALAAPRDAGAVAPRRWRQRRGGARAQVDDREPGRYRHFRSVSAGIRSSCAVRQRARLSRARRLGNRRDTTAHRARRRSAGMAIRSGARSGKCDASTTSSPAGTARQRSPTRNGGSPLACAPTARCDFSRPVRAGRPGIFSRWSR